MGGSNAEKATVVTPISQPMSLPPYEPEFEVSFSGEDDSMDPRNISTARKWLIVSIITSTSVCVACSSSIFSSAYLQIEAEFHVSETIATLGLTLFVAGLGLSPMILAPLSEVRSTSLIASCCSYSHGL